MPLLDFAALAAQLPHSWTSTRLGEVGPARIKVLCNTKNSCQWITVLAMPIMLNPFHSLVILGPCRGLRQQATQDTGASTVRIHK